MESAEDNDIIKKIKIYLAKIGNEKGKSNKCLNVVNLINYLITNKSFILKNPKFKKTVITKILAIQNDVKEIKNDNLINIFNLASQKLLSEIV